MRSIFLIFLLFFLVQTTFGQNESCLQNFKVGVFKYEDPKANATIVRTLKKQKEVWNDGKSYIIMKIVWLDERTYVLKVKKIVNAPGCMKKGDTITTTINSCEGNVYHLTSVTKNCGKLSFSLIRK